MEKKFRDIYKQIASKGSFRSPRQLDIIEVENFSCTLWPYERFASFKSRKLSIDYIKKEFLWYLRGDKYDLSICEHAKIWNDIKNEDGSINSNYGQYIFGELNQFNNVVKTLLDDGDSRRAVITILNSGHLFSDTKDVPCTAYINFRIRDNYLNMSVHMRSQDAVFGFGNDIPTFSFIHEMLFHILKQSFTNLQMGSYYHSADSMHVYERHFKLLDNIVNGDEYIEIDCPRMSGAEEVAFLIKGDFKNIPENYKFAIWLNS